MKKKKIKEPLFKKRQSDYEYWKMKHIALAFCLIMIAIMFLIDYFV